VKTVLHLQPLGTLQAIYTPEEMTSEPKRFNQQELNDTIPGVSLSKDQTELLAFRLKEINLFRE